MSQCSLLRSAFLLLACASAVSSLDLHPGLVEQWLVRRGGDTSSLRLVWTDSSLGEGGVVDWTAHLSHHEGGVVRSDTAVLRVFDLAFLLDSGRYRAGRETAWLKSSCLLPFQREDPDSVLGILDARLGRLVAWGTSHFPVINRLRPGAMAEFCSGGRNTVTQVETRSGGGTICFQGPASECEDCRPVPRHRSVPGLGVVAWRSLQRQEDWRLVRFDGQEVAHPAGRRLAGLHPGETWIWTQGKIADPPLRRLSVLDDAVDSGGVPFWRVEVEQRDGRGGSSRRETRLTVDTLGGRIELGAEQAWLWQPYAASTETRLALGFLADWAVPDADTMVLVDDGLRTECWGSYYHPSTRLWKAGRGVGTLGIFEEIDTYPQITRVAWTLASHSMEPVSVARASEPHPLPAELRALCAARPDLLLQRISLDGKVEGARGAGARELLAKRGVAVFVLGEGAQARWVRLLVP
jgi:hypothetical protein